MLCEENGSRQGHEDGQAACAGEEVDDGDGAYGGECMVARLKALDCIHHEKVPEWQGTFREGRSL